MFSNEKYSLYIYEKSISSCEKNVPFFAVITVFSSKRDSIKTGHIIENYQCIPFVEYS